MIIPVIFIIPINNTVSNHHELYTSARAVLVPRSRSIKVAKPIDTAKTNNIIPIKGKEKKNPNILFIVIVVIRFYKGKAFNQNRTILKWKSYKDENCLPRP